MNMLELNFLRGNPELVRKAISDKGEDADFDRFLEIDADRRELIRKMDDAKHRRNKLSKEIGVQRGKGQDTAGLMTVTRKLSKEIKTLERELKTLEDETQEVLIRIPNIPHLTVPTNKDENAIVKEKGTKPQFDFEPLPHWELGGALDILDFPSGARVCGSNFPSYKGLGARLERALINFMLDFNSDRGYTEIFPPFLVNRSSMFATGQLPKLEDDMYLIEEDDLFLNPTAEVPVTNIHREQVVRLEDLPTKYVAYTACFRREAGSYGADTKGLLRVHQFNKVELVKFTTPETSYTELDTMLDDVCAVMEALNLPYRVVLLCTGELSFASAKTYDVEVWAPGVQKYLEVSSVSNFEAFQARRADIRFRRAPGKKAEFVHTLNGSAVATPRTFAAIIENCQKKNGTVRIPEVLVPYMGVEQIG
jgi:seryl-tRNA synthetase